MTYLFAGFTYLFMFYLGLDMQIGRRRKGVNQWEPVGLGKEWKDQFLGKGIENFFNFMETVQRWWINGNSKCSPA